MAGHKYSEAEAVQKPAGELLRDELDWKLVYAWNDETFGDSGTLGRANKKEVLLFGEVRAALTRLNPELNSSEIETAITTLTSTLTTDSPLQTNEKKHELFIGGIPLTREKPDGENETVYVRLFDFDNPENNTFIAVEELIVESTNGIRTKRPDMVCFVNGIPLILMEFKRHDKDVLRAFEDNYTDYQDTIPHIFHYNAFSILSNGLEAKVGTLGSPYEFFHEWKRLNENEEGTPDLATMLRGICSKTTLLDLLENFIVFDHSDAGKTSKILARNHQYLGVNAAIEAYKDKDIRGGKLGVFWHTQGSGKSYSMVFFAKKIKRKFPGSPTFVIVTDRDELDTQIISTFTGCGLLGSKDNPNYVATTSGKELISSLKGNPSFIFTLMQKFNQDDAEPIYTDHDIIIISDEAHRTNNGIFADNMVRLLPQALRIGFTGTPLLTYDNITARTFGGYVSVYDFARAVQDGATVPLYYENRSDILDISNPDIDEELIDAVEQADLDEAQREKLERDLKREYHIVTAQKRLETIARDFVEHYTGVWESGKAMFICIDKITTVRMYNMVQELWAQKIREEIARLNAIGSDESEAREELERKIAWLRETEMAVVISEEQNEVAHFRNWGLDIDPHRAKMKKRELDKEFKQADNPFRIVFVCAMWLTGFDVKSLSVMYFDKPMKAHSLMQAIARANRVASGKNNGLIVDYIGVVKALRQALADYTRDVEVGISGDDPVIDKDELTESIVDACDHMVDFLETCDFDIEEMLTAHGLHLIELAKSAANAVSTSDETKKRFTLSAYELLKMFKFASRKDAQLPRQWAIRDSVDAIYRQLTKKRDTADTSGVMVQLQHIIDEHIEVRAASNESKTFDMSKINFELLHKEFASTPNQNLLVSDIRSVIEKRLEKALADNPAKKRRDFYDRYQKIIEEYNREQDRATIEATFIKLMELSKELDEETRRYVREGFTDEKQLAIYDMLFREDLSQAEILLIKQVAGDLVNEIQERLSHMNNWREKPETRSEIELLIRDKLYTEMPESYSDAALESFRGEIFNYFYELAA